MYSRLLAMSNPTEEYKISKDLRRTLPELQFFHEDHKNGKNRLFNVLKAYANYDNEIGYA
jgi:TBC1 domain family member 10